MPKIFENLRGVQGVEGVACGADSRLIIYVRGPEVRSEVAKVLGDQEFELRVTGPISAQ